MQTKIYLSDH